MGSHHRRAKTPKMAGRVNRHPRRLCLGVERRETSSYWQAPLTGAPQPLMDICAGSGLSPPGWWEATQRLAAPSEGAGPPTCGATKTGRSQRAAVPLSSADGPCALGLRGVGHHSGSGSSSLRDCSSRSPKELWLEAQPVASVGEGGSASCT